MSEKEKGFYFSLDLAILIFLSLFTASKVFQIGLCKDWSWWWVMSPLWIVAGILLMIIFAIVMGVLFAKGLEYLVDARWRVKRSPNLKDIKSLRKYRQRLEKANKRL